MAKNTAKTAQKPLPTVSRCEWCGDKLPIGRRSHAKFCCDRCRYYAAVDRGNSGKVYRTTVLKSGMISVVLHMTETTLKAGDQVKVGK